MTHPVTAVPSLCPVTPRAHQEPVVTRTQDEALAMIQVEREREGFEGPKHSMQSITHLVVCIAVFSSARPPLPSWVIRMRNSYLIIRLS